MDILGWLNSLWDWIVVAFNFLLGIVDLLIKLWNWYWGLDDVIWKILASPVLLVYFFIGAIIWNICASLLTYCKEWRERRALKKVEEEMARVAAEEEAKAAAEKAEIEEKKRLASICPECNKEWALDKCITEIIECTPTDRGNVRYSGKRLENAERYDFDLIEQTYCWFCDYRDDNEKYRSSRSPVEVGCPKCKSVGSIYLKDSKIIERFITTERQSQRTAKGTYKDVNIKINNVIEEHTFACSKCDYTTTARETKQLG